MIDTAKIKNTGLRGVTVADTKISLVDGENGILLYRGYRIEELARNSTFEETAYLLLHDALPDRGRLEDFTRQLARARQLPSFLLNTLKTLPHGAQPIDVLQASMPLLAMADSDLKDDSPEALGAQAVKLIARTASVVAAWHRIRHDKEPVPSDDKLSHAENFLWLLAGEKPDPETAKDLDTALVLHADHSFNPSTFACREVVSTRAHMYAGAAAGVGALSGSLHGGANAQVMKMLTELKDEKDIPAWVKRQLDGNRKIMGMGHAVYKTFDPRARFLKDMCFHLARKLGQEHWCSLSGRIEESATEEFNKRGKTTIKPNVDFYSAPVYHLMGIPGDLMTPLFAIARIAGWSAHIIEEKTGEAQGKPALYRPSSEYVGNYCGRTGCVYEGMDART